MKWIPRDLNSFADHLSRIIYFDDYTINDDVFQILDVRWGPNTIDRSACSYNVTFSALILHFTSQVLRLSTLFYKTESLRTIGYFLQFPKLRELSII